MKKIISLVLISIFLVSLVVLPTTNVIAQDASSSGSPADVNPESLQTLDEVEAALAAAKAKLSSAGFSFKLLQKIKQLEGRLQDLIVDGEGAKPTKCASLVDQSISRTDQAIKEITNKICSDSTQRTAYRGMCNPFLSNFSECEAKEHGHGGGHGGMMSGSGEGMMGGGSTDMAKPCLSAEEAQLAIADLQRSRDALVKISGLDANTNSVPDLCEKQN